MNEKTPEIPAQLWMLWHQDDGGWVLSVDDAPGADTFIVAFTEAEAKAAAEHQNETYNLDCVPVRVK